METNILTLLTVQPASAWLQPNTRLTGTNNADEGNIRIGTSLLLEQENTTEKGYHSSKIEYNNLKENENWNLIMLV